MNKGKVYINKNLASEYPVDDRFFCAFVEHLGNVIYNGIYNPSHPEADENGFRKDVIALVKDLKLAGIRYPGGNFVCSYNWEDSVGPVEKRPVRADLAWRQTEPNTVGLAEFEKWVKAIDSELIMAVNLSTRGAVDAANLVEYCNHPSGTFYSDLRIEHGHKEPYGIKTWCVGNEVDGPWNIGMKKAEMYAWDAMEAAKAMRRIDPDIELVAVGSSGTQLDTYLEWDRIVLEQVYDSCDYISLHRYMGMPAIDNPSTYNANDTGDYLELVSRFEQHIMNVKAVCDYVKGRKQSDKTMFISLDEYNVIDYWPDEEKDTSRETEAPWKIGPCRGSRGMSMRSTLLFGLSMLAMLRHSDRIKLACQSILINGNGMVICEGNEDVWVNGSYHIFKHCSEFGRGKVLNQKLTGTKYDTATCKNVSSLDSVCIYHEENGELDIFVINKSGEEMEFELDASCFNALSEIEHLVVSARHLNDRNSAEEKNNICTVVNHDINISGNMVCSELSPYSWNVLRLQEKQND